MGLNVSTNMAAARANFYLSRNNLALQKSLTRLASGSRVINPADDAGGLAVAMKLESSINRLAGAEKNIQNAMSFLEVQDGILETVGQIVDRMSELKGLYHDVMKNTSDRDSYNNEFKDLQVQLYDMSNEQFNKVLNITDERSRRASAVARPPQGPLSSDARLRRSWTPL